MKKGSPLEVGFVLAQTSSRPVMWRITHLFERSIYLMPVTTPERARYTVRPKRFRRLAIEGELKAGALVPGRLKLPPEFTSRHAPGSEDAKLVAAAFDTVAPLVRLFETESMLDRTSFNAQIALRALELGISVVSLRRRLLRFWYFGGLRQSLQSLRSGPDPGTAVYGELPAAKRRGRQPLLAKKRGPNHFLVRQADIDDMVAATARCAKTRTTLKDAYESYLKTEFSARHPVEAKKFADGKTLVPVTDRQFRLYVKENEALSDELRGNVGALAPKSSTRSLQSTGPGDAYELDATGGQIFIVDSANPGIVLGKATIYLLIDRWSRYLVSIYVTLLSPSWEALRVALRIAFTSRENFKALGIAIDDERWPPGVVPAHVYLDRGSDMISEAMLKAAVEDLLIVGLVLPALTPDGKAIVERVIRTLKDKTRARGTPGMYSKQVVGPKSKNDHKKARKASVHSLVSLYRVLVDVADEYNHSPHRALKTRAELRVAGIAPTPVDAYRWGLENLTGIRRPPLTDSDYNRLLMTPDTATLTGRTLSYREQRYFPANREAARIARKASSKARSVQVMVDRLQPTTLLMPSTVEDWPEWKIDQKGEAWFKKITLEEQDAFSEHHSLTLAEADHGSLVAKMNSVPPVRPARKRVVSGDALPDDVRRRSTAESNQMARTLAGAQPVALTSAVSRSNDASKAALDAEAAEERATIDGNRRRRKS